MKFFNALISVISLFIGALIYLLFRPDYLVMFSWVEFIGMADTLVELRGYFLPLSTNSNNWIIYSMPNGLWLLSFSFLMLLTWGNKLSIYALYWTLFLLVIALLSEVMQFFQIIYGVFDIADIVAYILGFLPVLLYQFSRRLL